MPRKTQRRRRPKRRTRKRGGQRNSYAAQAASLKASLFANTTATPNTFYTYIAWDEIPNPNLAPGYLHEFVKNIPADENGKIQLNKGHVVAPYVPPTPPLGSGKHTYHFALYAQPNPELPTQNISERSHYDREAVVKSLGLNFIAHHDFSINA
jgi:phosphatidylethanolamine-binding protein (PEBP) family uncharacterized protein